MAIHFLFFILLSFLPLSANEEKQSNDQKLVKVSEAFGHLIGKNINTIGVKFDLAHVIKGLKDSAEGKESPMTEVECIEAISSAQKEAQEFLANENLNKADAFLKENATATNIVVLEEGKLQYKIDVKGNGANVESNSSPVIRYTGKYLDGTVFGASQEDETLTLDETIPGFQKGIVGMKEGEKRTLFIHPEYGYGTQGYLPPNSLLTFEIEVIKANDPTQEELISAEPAKKFEPNSELLEQNTADMR